MQNKNNQQSEQDTNSQRELDKNETVNTAAADVVDYGRSEQKAVENNKQSSNERSNSAEGNDAEK